MSSTNKTAELQLSQFVGTDIPSILTDYNGDMQKIDAGVREVKQATAGAIGDLSSVTSRVTNAEQSISGLNSTVQGITARVVIAENNIDTLTNNVTAQGTRLTDVENDISKIDANFDKIALTGSTYGEVLADALAKAQSFLNSGMTNDEIVSKYYVVANRTEFLFDNVANKTMYSNAYAWDVSNAGNTTSLYTWYAQQPSSSDTLSVTRTSLEFSNSGVTRTVSDRTTSNVSYAYLIRRAGA